MDYANADGTAAEMCGNGIRCVGALLHDRGSSRARRSTSLTSGGHERLTLHADPTGGCDGSRSTMGVPSFTRAAIPMRGPAWETFLRSRSTSAADSR